MNRSMASRSGLLIGCVVFFMGLASVLGTFECEELPIEDCAFAVSSSGARCVLETEIMTDGTIRFLCQTSLIIAEKLIEWIETDECVKSCGLDRASIGLSTDDLAERDFTKKICSSHCHNQCPNIIDLFTSLAAGEGVQLPHLCKAERSKSRKLISKVVWASRSRNTLKGGWGAGGPTAEPVVRLETNMDFSSAHPPYPSVGDEEQ